MLGRSEVGRGIGRGGAGCAVERAAESVLGRVRGEEGKRVGPGVRGKGLGRAGRELGLGFWEVGWKTGPCYGFPFFYIDSKTNTHV